LEEFEKTNIVLEALFEGKNPFDYQKDELDFKDENY